MIDRLMTGLRRHYSYVSKFYACKIGKRVAHIFLLLSVDGFRKGEKKFFNTVEEFIVAMPDEAACNKPVPPQDSAARKLFSQMSTNIIPVQGVKRGGYRMEGKDHPLNPFEKPVLLNGFIVTTFTQIGDSVISLFAVSVSLNEICMMTGRYFSFSFFSYYLFVAVAFRLISTRPSFKARSKELKPTKRG